MPENTGPSAPGTENSPAQNAGSPSPAAEGAGIYLVRAAKMLLADPVGKIVDAFRFLGPGRAAGLGAGFGTIFVVCSLITLAIYYWKVPGNDRYGRTDELTAQGALAAVLFSLAVVAVLSLGSFVARSLVSGSGSFGQDLYVAGLTVLPLMPVLILAALLAKNPLAATAVLGIGGTFSTLIFYAAMLDLHGMSRRAASMMTPLALTLASGAGALMLWLLL